MVIIGIHSGHDSSAAIVKNGEIIADVAEERFTRIKHCSNLPINSIQYCMEKAGINDINEFDQIAVANTNIIEDLRILLGLHQDADMSMKKFLLKIGKNFLGVTQKKLPIYYQNFKAIDKDKIKNVEHHLAHASSAYYTQNNTNEMLIFSMDGIGDGKSISIWKVKNNNFKLLKSWSREASIGFAYSIVTEGLHWHHGDGEGKTMGLAPYGDYTKCKGVLDEYFPHFYNGELIKESGFGESYYWNEGGFFQWHFDEAWEIEELAKRYGKENIAAEAQRLLEKNVMDIVFSWAKKTGINDVCFAGGIFLNVKLNQRIWENRKGLIKSQHIFPNSGDSGIALGAALYQYFAHSKFDGMKLDNLYLGPSYKNESIKKILNDRNLIFKKSSDIEEEVSQLLAKGQIVGWFQGRMESGPRALGNRSILMSPLEPENKDIINSKVKFRESFRPFCPSILYEKRDEYLIDARDEFFMITSFRVKDDKIDKIPAVVHVDGTARPQLVKREYNESYWKLIHNFGKITGEYVLLNTSFNIKGEPIINTPQEAIRCFYDGGIDVLALGDYLVYKNGSYYF